MTDKFTFQNIDPSSWITLYVSQSLSLSLSLSGSFADVWQTVRQSYTFILQIRENISARVIK